MWMLEKLDILKLDVDVGLASTSTPIIQKKMVTSVCLGGGIFLQKSRKIPPEYSLIPSVSDTLIFHFNRKEKILKNEFYKRKKQSIEEIKKLMF